MVYFYRNGSIYYENAVKSGNGEIITYSEFKKNAKKKCDWSMFYRQKVKINIISLYNN